MSFIYIFVTVTCGYPLLYGIASAAGLDSESRFVYLSKYRTHANAFSAVLVVKCQWQLADSCCLPPFLSVRLFDAAIYFWLPQINVTIVRLVQGRNLLHRMVGRTVVIGDIPWVASSAEAFLSKVQLIFLLTFLLLLCKLPPFLTNPSCSTDICGFV
jgi:hypothetical protein